MTEPALPQTEPPAASPVRTNGLALASLALGIIWLVGLGSVLAIVLGVVGVRQIDRSGGAETGRGLAIAGIVLGSIGVLLTAFLVLGGAWGSGTGTSDTGTLPG